MKIIIAPFVELGTKSLTGGQSCPPARVGAYCLSLGSDRIKQSFFTAQTPNEGKQNLDELLRILLEANGVLNGFRTDRKSLEG